MTDIAVVAPFYTFLASLGAMLDGHSRLGEAYSANPAMGDHARPNTRLRLLSVAAGPIHLAGGRTLDADGDLASSQKTPASYTRRRFS